MSNVPDRDQNARVRERFTRSADAFVKFAVPHRGGDAEKIAALAALFPSDLGLDLACGPGTFTMALARKTKQVFGLDLTPALLERARRKASAEGVENVALICGDATAIPFRDGSFDVAVCGYSLHHMTEPRLALEEVVRVLRPGGRLAVVDLCVPEGADEETHNGVERARDASHTHTLARSGFPRLIEAAGFRVRSAETLERPRLFSEWMHIAGWEPGDPHWRETRRRMEATLSGDAGGFHPRLLAGRGDGEPELEFTQSCLFLAATKV
jgi:ubiquinone/menaquinone biosynthesis C-methylase UbiE